MRWTINLDSYPSRRSPTNSVEEAYIVYHLLGHVFGGIVVMQRDVEAGDAVGHVADGAEVIAAHLANASNHVPPADRLSTGGEYAKRGIDEA